MPVVRLRGLPFSAKKEDILDFLDDVCVRNNEEGIHFIYRNSVRPSGEAFVELERPEDEDAAIRKHKSYLKDRYIEVFISTESELDRYMSERTKKAAPVHPTGDYVIRLLGLPTDMTRNEVARIFYDVEIAPNGIALIMDHTGCCIGEGYIRIFPSRQNLDKAMMKNNLRIGRRYLQVAISDMKMADYAIQLQVDRNRMFQSSVMRPQRGGMHPASHYRERSPVGSKSGLGYWVYMRGIPFGATQKEIADFVHPAEPITIRMMKGDANVEFYTAEDRDLAMTKNMSHMGSRYIEMFVKDDERDADRYFDRKVSIESPQPYYKPPPAPVPPPYDMRRN